MVIAQSIAEYGAASSLSTTIQSLASSATSWLGTIGMTTWIVVAVVLVGLFVFLRR